MDKKGTGFRVKRILFLFKSMRKMDVVDKLRKNDWRKNNATAYRMAHRSSELIVRHSVDAWNVQTVRKVNVSQPSVYADDESAIVP